MQQVESCLEELVDVVCLILNEIRHGNDNPFHDYLQNRALLFKEQGFRFVEMVHGSMSFSDFYVFSGQNGTRKIGLRHGDSGIHIHFSGQIRGDGGG